LDSSDYTYNSKGHLLSENHWVSGTGNYLLTQYSYNNSNGTLASITDPDTGVTSFSNFTCNGLLPQTITFPLSSVGSASVAYDNGCKGAVIVSSTDVNNNTTTYSHNDPLWRLTAVNRPDGGSTTYSYNTGNSFPWSTSSTTTLSSNQSFTGTTVLDGLGRAVLSAGGNFSKLTDPNSSGGYSYSGVTFNNLSQVSERMHPYYTTSDPTYAYDAYTYDALGRVTNVNYFGGNSSSFNVSTTYTGRAVEVARLPGSSNFRKIYQYDGFGRLVTACSVVSATQANSQTPYNCNQDISGQGFELAYYYDIVNNLTSAWDETNNVTRSYTYDGQHRLASESNPENAFNTVSYSYDTQRAGDLYQRTAPAPNQTGSGQVVTTYTHDLMHRLTQVSYNDGKTPSSNFAYDQTSLWGNTLYNTKGRMNAAWLAGGTNIGGGAEEVMSYDKMGRQNWSLQCTPETCGSGGYGINYTYDWFGDVLSANNGSGGKNTNITWNYQYDALGQLQEASTNTLTSTSGGTLISGLTYNALGVPISSLLGNGLQESWSWLGNPMAPLSYSMGSAYSFSSLSDWGGLIWGGNDSINGNWSYTYDGFERLATSSQSGGSAFSYIYDAEGNRWQQNVTAGSGPAPQYSFNAYNHIASSGFAYDAAGNMTNDAYHTYGYDPEGRIIQVDSSPASDTYVYDALSRRIGQYNSSGANEYLFDLAGHAVTNLAAVPENGSGTICGSGCGDNSPLESTDVYLGNRHLGYYWNNSTTFTAQDWIGTVRARTDLNGNRVETCSSLPFGDNLVCGASDGMPGYVDRDHFAEMFMFDWTDNTSHAQHRSYSINQGRWLTPDPAGLAAMDPSNPQTWNRYAYVLNNPVSFTDPTGLECVWDDGSYDSEFDPHTGWPGGCQDQGGSWVELGQNGNWSNQADASNALMVSDIQNGLVNSVMNIGADGQQYSTFYNSAGQATETITPDATTFYSYGQPASGGWLSGVANNGPSVTPVVQRENGKSKPNVPPEWGFCSGYRDGTGAGDAMYHLCMSFPNGPWSNCVRGNLLNQWTPNGNPLDLSIYLFWDHPKDFATCAMQ